MLISNPFTSLLFFPLVAVFSALLGLGLLGITVARKYLMDNVLKKQLLLRWASWAMIAPLTVFALLSGKLVFAVLCSLLALVGTQEYCKISARSLSEKIVLGIFAIILPVVAMYQFGFLLPLVFAGAVFLIILSFDSNKGFEQMAVSILGLLYVPLLASFASAIFASSNDAPAILVSVIGASALANIAAFVFGKLLGGPRLAPPISPNKTWFGVLGSLVGAYFGFYLLTAVCSLNLSPALGVLIPLAVAICGVVGDLFESQFKRAFCVKDAASWLPGFGGILDRIDGLLFVLPAVFYLLDATGTGGVL